VEFRLTEFDARLWRRLVVRLFEYVRRNQRAAVRVWFRSHYPALMRLSPGRRHRGFVAGFIERVEEKLTYSRNNVRMTSGDTDA
jgi:hypothetical protein